MTDAIIQGGNTVTLVNQGSTWTKQEGETLRQVWRGPLLKAIDFYINAITSGSYDQVDIDEDGPVGTVTLSTANSGPGDSPTNEDENAIWEVAGQDLLKDLRAHPYLNPSGSIIPEIVEADKALAENEPFTADGIWPVQVQRYYNLRREGVQSYVTSSIVIRRTIKTTSREAIDASYVKVNRVVDLLTEINPPQQIIGNLLLLPIANDVAGGFDEGEWEWLKKTPTITTSDGGQKFTIKDEWWGAEVWSLLLYGGTWDP